MTTKKIMNVRSYSFQQSTNAIPTNVGKRKGKKIEHPDGIEVERAIAAGYTLECFHVKRDRYKLASDSQNAEVNDIEYEGSFMGFMLDLEKGHMVVYVQITDGPKCYSVRSLKHAYSNDGI